MVAYLIYLVYMVLRSIMDFMIAVMYAVELNKLETVFLLVILKWLDHLGLYIMIYRDATTPHLIMVAIIFYVLWMIIVEQCGFFL